MRYLQLLPRAVKKINEGNAMESSFHLGPGGPGFSDMSFEVRPEHCTAEVPCECLQGSIPSGWKGMCRGPDSGTQLARRGARGKARCGSREVVTRQSEGT